MKRLVLMTAAAAMLAGSAMLAMAEVKSLRGELAPNAAPKPPDLSRVMVQEGGFKRAWKLQPPLIPHKIDRERITRKVNTCLRCHSPENHKREHAPMASKTHFTDSAHPSTANLMRRRWFCNQCHVRQLNARPLVENVFGR